MTDNPPRRTALISLSIAFIAVIMIFAPEYAGIDGMNGGFAISFASLLIACIAIVAAVFYFSLASKLDKILRGEGLLAHWTYTPEQWTEYSQKEYVEEITEKKGIFLTITAFALFFGILFWAFDPEAGFYVFLTMMGLIALVAFTWQFSAWYNYRQNMGGVREAYIAKDGIYMNRRFISWRIYFTSFDSASIEKKRGLSLLVFRYTAATKTGPQIYTTRVPIPPGQEENAKSIAQQINQQN